MEQLPFITIDGKVERLIYFSKCGKYWSNMPFDKPKKNRKRKVKNRGNKPRYF